MPRDLTSPRRWGYSWWVGWLTRGFLLVLAVLMLVVPTVQLMSAVSHSVAHQVSGKTLGKTSTGSRIPAVVAAPPGLDKDGVATRMTTSEQHDLRPGFSTAPFVPPRG